MSPISKLRSLPLAALIYPSFSSQPLNRQALRGKQWAPSRNWVRYIDIRVVRLYAPAYRNTRGAGETGKTRGKVHIFKEMGC
jgi:hypothetical protein